MWLQLEQAPVKWNSVHSGEGINFRFSHPSLIGKIRNAGAYIEANGFNNGTLGRLAIDFDFAIGLQPLINIGDKVTILSGTNTGAAIVTKILGLSSTRAIVETNLAFTSNQFPVSFRLHYSAKFRLMTGNLQRAEFIVSPRNDNKIYIDVSEFLKAAFTLNTPIQGLDNQLIRPFFIQQVLGASTTQKQGGDYIGLISTMKHAEILQFLPAAGAQYGKPLNSFKPILFSCSPTVYSVLGEEINVNGDTDIKVRTVIYDPETQLFEGGNTERDLVTQDGRILTTESGKKLRI